MKQNLSQKQRVINKLLRDRYITRNECLRVVPAITRLGSLIKFLEYDNWSFEASYTADKKDYEYRVEKCPYEKVTLELSDGRTITKYRRKNELRISKAT